MKKTINAPSVKALFAALAVLLLNMTAQAQDKVTVTHTEMQTTSWISDNWLWVAGGVLLLIIIIALASGGSRRRTTVTRDNATGSTTTTTVED